MRTFRHGRWQVLTAAGAAAALLISACSANNSGSGSASGGSSSSKPVIGGTLRFGMLDAPEYLDPHDSYSYPDSIIADNITDRLTWQDPHTGTIEPYLATSWSYNSSLTEFTFHLRKGVTFSNGTPFNAAIVKANFDQDALGDESLGIAAEPTAFPNYVGTYAPSPYTVVVKFSQPDASFLQFTSFTGGASSGFIALSTLKESRTQRVQDPPSIIGTGPFVIKSFTYEKDVILVRRKGYDWAPPALAHTANGGASYLNEVDLETIPEASVRTGSLESGDIDATLDVQPTDEKPLRAAGYQILFQSVPGRIISFDLNTSLFPTNDINVRKALIIGWDRDALTKSVLTTSYKVATSPLSSLVPGYVNYSQTALKYDPAEAEKLLNDDGWKMGPNGIRVKDGKELTVKLLGSNNLVANQPAYELMQEQLKQIGINVELGIYPVTDLAVQEAKEATNWNGAAGNTSKDDPSVLWQIYSPDYENNAFVAKNSAEGEEIASALQKIQLTLNPAAREAASVAAQNLITQYALTDPVYEPSQVVAAAPYVHDIGFDAQSRNDFYNTWLSK
jgi:peptide/nickel transport system substrate-binding protein